MNFIQTCPLISQSLFCRKFKSGFRFEFQLYQTYLAYAKLCFGSHIKAQIDRSAQLEVDACNRCLTDILRAIFLAPFKADHLSTVHFKGHRCICLEHHLRLKSYRKTPIDRKSYLRKFQKLSFVFDRALKLKFLCHREGQ